MNSHVKGQRGASSFDLPVAKSSGKLLKVTKLSARRECLIFDKLRSYSSRSTYTFTHQKVLSKL